MLLLDAFAIRVADGYAAAAPTLARALELLLAMNFSNEDVGRRLSPRPTIAHVNGAFTGIRNEASIIEQDGRAYVLTLYLRGQNNEQAAEVAIARASEQILNVVLRRG